MVGAKTLKRGACDCGMISRAIIRVYGGFGLSFIPRFDVLALRLSATGSTTEVWSSQLNVAK